LYTARSATSLSHSNQGEAVNSYATKDAVEKELECGSTPLSINNGEKSMMHNRNYAKSARSTCKKYINHNKKG